MPTSWKTCEHQGLELHLVLHLVSLRVLHVLVDVEVGVGGWVMKHRYTTLEIERRITSLDLGQMRLPPTASFGHLNALLLCADYIARVARDALM